MVLSNKKLKQKLRAELAQSLSSSLSNSEPKNDGRETKPTPKSLKLLLDSATQRPRLSKREKNRQKTQSEDSKHDEEEADEAGKEKKKENGSVGTKRKRDEKDGALGSIVNSDETKKKKKQKKKKKKNQVKKKKIEKGENEEVKQETLEIRDEVKMGVETNENIVDNSEVMAIGSTKVYVGGIPFYSTEDDIRSYFEGCGTVTEVDCMTFPESGNFRGIAIINFKTEAAAKRALALDGSDMGGLFLTIQPYKSIRSTTNIKASTFSPKAVEGYNRIYMGNLSWDITEDDLRNFFSGCKISSIKFGKDKESGEFRGYAHVDFSDNLSFTMALKLDQKIVCGRPAKISCAVPLKKGTTDRERIDQSDRRSEPKTTTNTEVETMTEEKVPAKVTMAQVIEPISVSIAAETNNNLNISTGTAVKSGKMRRRNCYECGEKGHISSECPKRIVDSTNVTVG